jgi:hypothetical protein
MKLKQLFYNNYISSDCFDSGTNQRGKLKHPPLIYFPIANVDPPIYWYVAYTEDCLNGMALQDEDEQTILQNYQIKNRTTDSDKITSKEIINNKNIEKSRIEKELKTEKNIQNLEFKHNTENETIKIIPNPVINNFKITSENNESSIKLLDLWGKEIISNIQINETISIEYLSSGIYFIEIKNFASINKIKLIKL